MKSKGGLTQAIEGDDRRAALKRFGRYAAAAPTVMLLLDSQSPAAAYNPGNNQNVGKAGESPNGLDFGLGDRGMSQ